MLKLIIGNKAYSSWSLRGWLAVKHSGLPFEEITVPMFDEAWDKRTEGDEFAPSGGKVPILWDDQTVIWDSLAIIEWLADKTDRARYWIPFPGLDCYPLVITFGNTGSQTIEYAISQLN